MSYIVKAIKLKDWDCIVIPLPPEIGISEGDQVSITILDHGEVLIKRIISEKKIIEKLKRGVKAKGFEGENVEDFIRSCKEWFKRH